MQLLSRVGAPKRVLTKKTKKKATKAEVQPRTASQKPT